MKKDISTELAPAAIGPYAQAVASGRAGDYIGPAADRPRDRRFPEGIAEQTRQSLENVKAILAEAGIGMDRVIKTTVFLSDMNNFGAMNEVYATFFRRAITRPFGGRGGAPAEGRAGRDRSHRGPVSVFLRVPLVKVLSASRDAGDGRPAYDDRGIL